MSAKSLLHFLCTNSPVNALENPLCAIKARKLCREFGLEIPNFVSEYYDEMDLALLRLPQDKKRLEQDIRRALRIKDNPYKQERRSGKR